MKKLFISFMAVMMSVVATAQTQDSPLPLVVGDNNYTGGAWTSVYFSYTAPSDQLLTLSGVWSGNVTCDASEVPMASNSSDKTCVFAVKGGNSYVFSTYVTESPLTFSMTAVERPYTDGTTCDNPIQATETPFLVPFYKSGSGIFGQAATIYISYTAEQDGRLEMTFPMSVSNFAYSTGCKGDYTSLTGEYVTGGWKATMEVDEGVTYYVKGSSANAMMATFKVVQAVPGASCADAWDAKPGVNTIPADAGEYWYSFTSPNSEMFAVLNASVQDDNTVFTLKTGCSSSYGDITQTGGIYLRTPLSAKSFRALSVKKTVTTSSDETFTLQFEPYMPYDKFETAQEIEPGDVATTPAYGGTYYYSVTAPENGNWFLDLSANGVVPEGTAVKLYDSKSDYLTLARGTDNLHYQVTKGTAYVVVWECPVMTSAIDFTVTFNRVQPGQTESDPLTARLGENEIPAWAAVYYNYTAVSDSWLVIKPASETLRPVVTCGGTAVTLYDVNGGGYRFEATSGSKYIIRYDGVDVESSYRLSEQAYAPGESSANPIDVIDGSLTLPAQSGKTWMKYTVPYDGILDVSTTIAYTAGASVHVYVGEISDANRQSLSTEGNYPDYTFKALSLTVKKDAVVYVCATLPSAQADAKVIFTMREAAPGETPDKPIVIDFDTNPKSYSFDRKIGYSDDPVWYSVTLPVGIFNLTSAGTFSMNMYKAGDTSTPFAQSSGSMFGPNEIKNVVIDEAGEYLLKLTSSSAAFDATLSVRDAAEGETPAKAISITVTSDPMDYTFPAMPDGAKWYRIELIPGEFNLIQDYGKTSLFKNDDTVTPIANTGLDFDIWKYVMKNVLITDAGVYLLRVESTSEAPAVLSGSALKVTTGIRGVGDGETSLSVKAVPGGIVVSAAGVVRIYDLGGRQVAEKAVDGEVYVPLNAGVYIVKSALAAVKVVVR